MTIRSLFGNEDPKEAVVTETATVSKPATTEVIKFLIGPLESFDGGPVKFSALPSEFQRASPDVNVKPFKLARHEVTVALWTQFVRETKHRTIAERLRYDAPSPEFDELLRDLYGSVTAAESYFHQLACYGPTSGNAADFDEDAMGTWRDPGFPQSDDHPVVCISYRDVQEFMAWLQQRTGTKFRLPTLLQMQFAAAEDVLVKQDFSDPKEPCRTGNLADASFTKAYPSGFGDDAKYSCHDGSLFTSSIEGFNPTNGIFDLIGNVAEWLEDCVDDKGSSLVVYASSVEGCHPMSSDGSFAARLVWSSTYFPLDSDLQMASAFASTAYRGFRLATD